MKIVGGSISTTTRNVFKMTLYVLQLQIDDKTSCSPQNGASTVVGNDSSIIYSSKLCQCYFITVQLRYRCATQKTPLPRTMHSLLILFCESIRALALHSDRDNQNALNYINAHYHLPTSLIQWHGSRSSITNMPCNQGPRKEERTY